MNHEPRCRDALALFATLALAVGCAGPTASGRRGADTAASALAAASAPAIVAKAAPRAFVRIASISDRSATSAAKANRNERTDSMLRLLIDDLQESPAITLAADQARELDIPSYSVDATIERMDQRVHGGRVEIACELRIAVADERGKMLFFLTNRAAVRVPLAGFRGEYAGPLQRDALEGAARSINDDLVARIESETSALARAELEGTLLAAE